MPKSLLVVCMALVLPSVVHAQYSYEDFIRTVEGNGPSSASLNSPRVAQAPTPSSELPTPAPQPLQAPAVAPAPTPESLQPEPSFQPVPQPMPMPGSIDFNQLIADEEVGTTTAPACGCSRSATTSCAVQNNSCGCNRIATATYCAPQLPPPYTLRGYFDATPCEANVWNNYSCEAAKECARIQRVLSAQCGH